MIRDFFCVDLRALAALRIGMALMVVFDLLDRARDLRVFYTDAGMFSRADFLADKHPWAWSLYSLTGSSEGVAAWFVLTGLCAVLMLVGYRTRIFTVLVWLLLSSLQARNIYVVQGGDVLLRLLLFWGMFLPLGARWSLDVAWCKAKIKDSAIYSLAMVGVMMQVVMVYVFSIWAKSEQFWLIEGEGVYYFMSVDIRRTVLGEWLWGQRELMRWLTRLVYLIQSVGVVLLFVPWRRFALRLIVPFVFIVWHLTMGLFISLGPFPWASALAMVVFLPGPVWDWVENRLPKWQPKLLAGCRVPRFDLPAWASVVAVFAILFSMWWNLAVLQVKVPIPKVARWAGYTMQLSQKWAIATAAGAADGWYIALARTENGELIDVLRDGTPLDYTKPNNLHEVTGRERWRKFYRNMWMERHRDQVGRWAAYLCREWEVNHADTPIRGIKMVLMREGIKSTGEVVEARPVALATRRCSMN